MHASNMDDSWPTTRTQDIQTALGTYLWRVALQTNTRSVITTDALPVALPSALPFCKAQALNLARLQSYRFKQKHRTAGHCGLSRPLHHLCLTAMLKRSLSSQHLDCTSNTTAEHILSLVHHNTGVTHRNKHKARRALARCAGTQMHIWHGAYVTQTPHRKTMLKLQCTTSWLIWRFIEQDATAQYIRTQSGMTHAKLRNQLNTPEA